MPRVFDPKGQSVGRFGKTKTSRRSENHDKRKKKRRSRSLPPISSPKPTKERQQSEEKVVGKEASYIGGFILENADGREVSSDSHQLPQDPNNAVHSRSSIVYHRSVALDTRCGRIAAGTDDDHPSEDAKDGSNTERIASPAPAAVLIGNTTAALQQWLATTYKRGVAPVLLTTTVVDPTHKSAVTLQSATSGRMRKVAYTSGVGVATTTTQSYCTNIAPVPVDCKQPSDAVSSSQGMLIPNTLTAEITWEIFTDMVLSQVQAAKDPSSKVMRPFDSVVVGTDVSMFADASIEDHVAGFHKFVAKVSPLIYDDQISQIEIICVQTGALILPSGETTNTEISEQAKDQAMKEADEDELASPTQSKASKEKACCAAIQQAMEALAYPETGTPLNISMRCIDDSMLSFHHLTREWVRESIGPNRKVVMELPETADGTQCSIVFDACYRTFPYSVGSVEAEGLLQDLDRVSATKLSVVRPISFAALDAGLLYGVPLRFESHLDNDLDRFRENQTLVQLLLQMLHDRGQTLLVRACSEDGNRDRKPEDDPLYVLMVQSEASSSAAPCSALLFHYANANDLLAEASTGIQVEGASGHEDNTTELLPNLAYVEYLEASLGVGTDADVFNPLLLGVDDDPTSCTKEPMEETDANNEAADATCDDDDGSAKFLLEETSCLLATTTTKLTTVPSFDSVAVADFKSTSNMEVDTMEDDVPMTTEYPIDTMLDDHDDEMGSIVDMDGL